MVVGQPEPQRGAGLVERIVSKVPHSMHVLTLIRAAGAGLAALDRRGL